MPGFFLYNASAGSASEHPPERLLSILREGGEDVRLHEFRDGERPRDLVRAAVESGATWIAVAGGDGTIEDGARALLGTKVPLGIIPCGTFNNFALSAGIPADPCEACQVVVRGEIRPIDVGTMNGEAFFECAGVGLDAALFPVGEEIKSGGFLRGIEFLRRAYRYRRKPMVIEFDGPVGDAFVSGKHSNSHRISHVRRIRRTALSLRALLVTVSNGPYYGMNFAVAPEASLDDGLLTVSVFKRFNKLALWWHFLSISFGRRSVSPELLTFRCRRLNIRGIRAVPVHLDGSVKSEWPLEFTMRQSALRIFGNAKVS